MIVATFHLHSTPPYYPNGTPAGPEALADNAFVQKLRISKQAWENEEENNSFYSKKAGGEWEQRAHLFPTDGPAAMWIK